MKKKTMANCIMVAIIVAIVVAGVLGVGYIQGWFDTAGNGAVLQDVTGVIHLQRDGVSYSVQMDTVLRPGDQIAAQKGATATIAWEADRVILGSSAALTVIDPHLELEVTAGEVFVHTVQPIKLSFEGGDVTIADATAALSVRSGAQSLSVFRGTVAEATAGNKVEYIGGERTVHAMTLSSLNDFLIRQIGEIGRTATLCYTREDLTKLENDRQQALQDMVADKTEPTQPPQHVHSYSVTILSPDCTVGGYTEHTCVCGDTYRSNETAPVGHRWGHWEVRLAPTTTTQGRQERSCQSCHTTEQKVMEKLPQSHVHSYTEEVISPTCEAEGYTLHTCVCGESYISNAVKATGHHYESIVTKPSCTVEGYTKYLCACGDGYTDSTTPATGHSWSGWVTVQAATTAKEGVQERSCRVCSAKERSSIPMEVPQGDGYVYISIVCDTILDNMEELTPGKVEFVPADGVILPMVEVVYNEGETVFEVLKRVCEKTNIQLEYSWTPLYDSYYIEGIHNLYEFDCGEQSGWMYKVNEWFPNYGCSGYEVSDGDVIVWCYTCKGLGMDVGDSSME